MVADLSITEESCLTETFVLGLGLRSLGLSSLKVKLNWTIRHKKKKKIALAKWEEYEHKIWKVNIKPLAFKFQDRLAL